MKTLQFKTNINCSGCVAKITPVLDGETGIANWKVDTGNPHKILTVQTEQLTEKGIIETLKNAGFKAEKV